MGAEQNVNQEVPGLDYVIKAEIDNFVIGKRKTVVELINTKEYISHTDLAHGVNSSITSMSNIMASFLAFRYKLIESKKEGKYRYYFLTPMGKKYAQAEFGRKREDENIISPESFRMMQSVKEQLVKIQKKYGDQWESILNNELMSYIHFIQLSEQYAEDIQELLVEQERMLLNDYFNASVDLFVMCSSNSILANTYEKFFEKFNAFMPLLKALNEEKDVLLIYDCLTEMITQKETEVQTKNMPWTDNERTAMAEIFEYILRLTAGKDKKRIYEYLNGYTAGNKQLSAYLALVIYDEHKRRNG